MPGFFKSFEDHRQRYDLWKNRITNINNLEIPDSFAADMSDKEKDGTYNRFNGYVKQWMLGILCGDENKRNDIHSSEFSDFNIYADTLPDNWYKRAISAANSKSGKGLPVLGTPDSKTSHNLYTKVMPAYRALKESFDKRPFWHWITRHAEYTAERDALNAIKGFTRAATGIDPKTFDNMYMDYSSKVSMSEDPDYAKDFDRENPLYYRENNQSELYEKLEAELNKPDFCQDLAKEIADNLPASDIENDRKLSAVNISMRTLRANMLRELDNYDRSEKSQLGTNMLKMVSAAWASADEIVKAYYARQHKKSMSPMGLTERQLITDIIMKKLSPVTADPSLAKYADGYVLKNQSYFPTLFVGYGKSPDKALETYEQAKADLNKVASNNEVKQENEIDQNIELNGEISLNDTFIINGKENDEIVSTKDILSEVGPNEYAYRIFDDIEREPSPFEYVNKEEEDKEISNDFSEIGKKDNKKDAEDLFNEDLQFSKDAIEGVSPITVEDDEKDLADYMKGKEEELKRHSEREQQRREDLKKSNAEKQKGKEKEGLAKLSFPAPQTLSKAKALMKNNNNHVFSVFNAFLVNSGESAQTNSNAATAIIPIAQNTVTNIWSRGSDWEMDKLTIQAFADIYGKLNIALPNMEVGDKLIAAQKMTDLMLNTFSPIGSKPEFEKFRNNYGISKMSNNEIRELTGYNGNVEDLMKNVKTELNIREKIQIDKEVLGEDPAKKAPKVENIDVLQKEKIVE